MELDVKSVRGRSRAERNRLAKAVTVFALALLTGIVLVTGAIFTSTASIGANTFTTGDVTLTTSPTTALVTFTGMAPGDQVTALSRSTTQGRCSYATPSPAPRPRTCSRRSSS